ncbi:MAG: isochorismatase family protein [Candidatus Melainabacteria bacterium]|jgi:hypothetical protein|nr:isochorismatase family protein [Candidatus Melainabacteria bacterium]
MLLELFTALSRWLGSKPVDSDKPRVQPFFESEIGARYVNPLFYSDGMGRPSLVVVDMQTGFLCQDGSVDELIDPAWQAVLDEVEALVVDAVARGWKVYLLEYAGYGTTFWQITRHLENYPLACRLTKSRWDGSMEVVGLNDRCGGSSEYLVCGCYSEQCVEQTVVSLAKSQPRSLVRVATQACLPHDPGFEWSRFPKANNLQLDRAA